MKHNIIYLLTFAYLLIPTNVSATQRFGTYEMGVAIGFLVGLVELFFSLFFILPILLGLILPRRFIIVWHFLLFYIVLVPIIPFMRLALDLTKGVFDKDSFLILLLLSILYTSFFTIIAYLSSTIGAKFKKIQKVQNVLHRSKPSLSKLFIFLVYALALIPMAFIPKYYDGMNDFYFYANTNYVMLGIVLSLIVGIAFFFWLYKKSAQLPERNFTNQKKDWFYVAIVVVIFTIAIVLSHIFYPSSYTPHTSHDDILELLQQ